MLRSAGATGDGPARRRGPPDAARAASDGGTTSGIGPTARSGRHALRTGPALNLEVPGVVAGRHRTMFTRRVPRMRVRPSRTSASVEDVDTDRCAVARRASARERVDQGRRRPTRGVTRGAVAPRAVPTARLRQASAVVVAPAAVSTDPRLVPFAQGRDVELAPATAARTRPRRRARTTAAPPLAGPLVVTPTCEMRGWCEAGPVRDTHRTGALDGTQVRRIRISRTIRPTAHSTTCSTTIVQVSAHPHHTPRSTAARPSPEPSSVERARHVWVAPSARQVDLRPYPGLLVTWQRRDDGWWAYVVMLLPTGALVANWVPASLLRPARGPSPS